MTRVHMAAAGGVRAVSAPAFTPWTASVEAKPLPARGHWYVVLDEEENGIGEFYGEDHEENVANVRLAAAAPELYASAEETHAWVRRIQDVLTGYLVPDGYDSDEAVNRLLEMLDGPEQREIQGRAFAAIAKARGETL